jgi:8-oxo-dGTP pyrophosphatase MutT (NUDIX family)
MELNSEVPTGAPRDAATVVMLRDDAAHGLEVFLLKRHGLSDVLGGAYVFPGGKLDASDTELDAQLHLDQPPAQLHLTLAEPELTMAKAQGLFVAALREAFEESGVLFMASHSSSGAAHGLAAQTPFNQMLSDHSLRLQTSALLPWSRWITPRMPSVTNKRFDTRFFVAAIPADQEARHDNHEATESVWVSPRLALEQYWTGKIELAPPQIMSLAHLARHSTVQGVLEEARRQRPPLVLPETFDENGTRVLCYPGDIAHSVPTRALPGPSRLLHRKGRFEPVGGFEALFD